MDLLGIGKKLAAIGLPILGTSLGGPMGGQLAGMVAGALGLGDGATADDMNVALGKLDGATLLRLRELEADTARARLEQDTTIALAQIETNQKAEEYSQGYGPIERFIKTGWRPAAAWICVAGLAYEFLIKALAPWTASVVFKVAEVPALPGIDTMALLTLLGGLLGLSTQRFFERLKGKA